MTTRDWGIDGTELYRAEQAFLAYLASVNAEGTVGFVDHPTLGRAYRFNIIVGPPSGPNHITEAMRAALSASRDHILEWDQAAGTALLNRAAKALKGGDAT